MRRMRILCYVFLAICLIIIFKILFNVCVDVTDDKFTNLNLCPACYGSNLCPHFFHGKISLIGISKFEYFKVINNKNVYSGKLNSDRVILKKLAHCWEIIEKDMIVCKKAKSDESCRVNEALLMIIESCRDSSRKIDLLSLFNALDIKTDMSHCTSKRLLSYILGKIYNTSNELHKIGQMMYGLIVNPEAVLLQAFPQAEGWPFPHYYGSCGRIIVEEYVGRTLTYFEDAPWKQRIDISYQLLLIAQMLTENFSNFALYMTDVNMDNFAVRSDGTVLLIDVEGIVVVDRFKTKGQKLHESKGEYCKDCLNFSYEDLCNSDLSDHNYYAILPDTSTC
nr:divergent protein kinase domain 2A [Parasteatoda tepidariorum]